MLTLEVVTQELFDEDSGKFITEKEEIVLEHSLVSLSKWESIHQKPFLDKTEKTSAEILSYIECMVLSPEDSSEILAHLSNDHYSATNDYLESSQSATTFGDSRNAPSREIITSELIYYWMVAFTIPFECETWHLNRLLTLIRICSIKNQTGKKMKRGEVLKRNADLNAQRKAALNTTG